MLRILFIRFWPVWIPLVLWLVWYLAWGKTKKKKSKLAKWEEKLWLWAALSSALILVISVVVFGLSQQADTEGNYVPAEYKDGQLIPGHIVEGEDAE